VLTWLQQQEAGALPRTQDFQGWLQETRSETAATSDERLHYVLQPSAGGSSGPVLDLVVSRRRKNGQWGRGRRVTLQSLDTYRRSPAWAEPVDRDIARLLNACPKAWSGALHPEGRPGGAAFQAILETGRCYWGDERLGPLQPCDARSPELEWVLRDDHYRLQPGNPAMALLPELDPPGFVDTDTSCAGVLHMPAGLTREHLQRLPEAPPIPAAEAGSISRHLALEYPGFPTPTPVTVEEQTGVPTPRLTLLFNPGLPRSAALKLGFRYGDSHVTPGDSAAVPVQEAGDRVIRIQRDPAAEQAAHDILREAGMRAIEETPGHFRLPGDPADRSALMRQWFDFQQHTLPRLREEGWEIEEGTSGLPTLEHAESVTAEVLPSGTDWFDLHFDLELEGRSIPLLPLVTRLLEEHSPDASLPETLYLDAGQGHFIAVPGERLQPVLETLLELFDRPVDDAGEKLSVSRLDAPRLLDMGDIAVHGAVELRRLAERLRHFDGIQSVTAPDSFKGDLRAYQQQGLNWMQFLREYELAGILADDMGLGKTIQTLAHLAVEKATGRMDRPSLIIAPTSLMGNWRREAGQFTPELEVLVLHGPQRKNYFDQLQDYDLVLTTYPLLSRDHEALEAQPWYYLILDEAQLVKNPQARASQVVRNLNARHRLCLTGTPMENHLGELWAQFDFLLPGFLGDQKRFMQYYRKPIEQEGDQTRLQRLSRRTAPFMLRRTKDHVASELPPRTELLRTTALHSRQATLYESIRLTMEKKVREAVARKGLARSHITILDALLKLRQVCCDPRLLQGDEHKTRGVPSAKLEMLLEILPELLDEGRRILLFSQFTTMLGLIQRELEDRGIAYSKLTGQTRKREAAIERFRSGQADVFLISLKAGGVGLNLTEADTVIHYDPWWNPAVEAQATDRAHRIGQDKPVFVYKLMTEGTVEEKILSLQARKQHLADNVHP
ncbi:MAG: DEAD/DEAH box helicase, partial [Thioalkalivibrio sp.]|nr:DEAD/DEAH box helicase [Thioalkalivibrio sp.]